MDRPLQIVFRDIQHSEALSKLIEDRVRRLENVYARIIGCRVVASVSHRGPPNTIAPLALSVEVEVPGRPLIVAKLEAKRKGEQTGLVNRAFDAVQRRLEQLTELVKDNAKRHENALESGVIARLYPDQDHGFIEVKGGPDLYFTRSCLMRGNFDELAVGVMVQIVRAVADGAMGPQASAVYAIERGKPEREEDDRHDGALEPAGA